MAMAGVKPGMVVHNAYGYGLFTGGLGFHQGAERLGALTIPVSGGVTARQALLLRDLQGQVLCSTPSYALHIAQGLREAGISPDELALQIGMFGAEPWTDAMREQLEAELGLTALNIYGLSEIVGPGVSAECPEARSGLHVQEDHFMVEVIDPETGESVPDGADGELVFTTLTKEAMPLLRYRTGDIASVTREPCACGRTFARMSAVRGRRDDMLIVRGVNLYPSQIEHVLLRVDGIAPHYQLVVERPENLDEITVHCEPTGSAEGLAERVAACDPRARSASAWPSRCSSPAPSPAARGRRSGSSISADAHRLERRALGRDTVAARYAPPPPDEPGAEVLPCPHRVLDPRAWSERIVVRDGPARVRALEAQRLGRGERDPAVALGVRVQAVDVPQPPVGGDRIRLKIDDLRAVLGREVADHRVQAPDTGRDATGEWIHRHGVGKRDREHVGTDPAQRHDHRLDLARHRGHVDLLAQHVVQAGQDADEIGLERDGGVELLGADLVRELAADREIGVAAGSGSSSARRSASRSAQPRKLPSGFGSTRPSVVLSPRATKRR